MIQNATVANIPDTTLPLIAVDVSTRPVQQASGIVYQLTIRLYTTDNRLVNWPIPIPMTDVESSGVQADIHAGISGVLGNGPAAGASGHIFGYLNRTLGFTPAT